MNMKQKKLLMGCLATFLLSIIFIPEQETFVGGITMADGYSLIWNLSNEVNLKVLMIEWFGIGVTFFALFMLFRGEDKDASK